MQNTRKTLSIVVLVAIVVFAVGGYIYYQPEETSQEVATPEMVKKEAPAQETMQNSNVPAKYIEFTKNSLETTTTDKRVLFFYASWCPTCRPVDEQLNSSQNKIPDDLTIIRVNYNDPQTDEDEKALAAKYGITYQHTFVQIDAQGNEVAKWNGGSLQELLENLK